MFKLKGTTYIQLDDLGLKWKFSGDNREYLRSSNWNNRDPCVLS